MCTYGDFEPFGIEVNNWSLLKDETQIKNLKLKLFSNKNMKVTPGLQENLVAINKSATGTLKTTKEWKELQSGKEVIKAAHNYMELCQAIHPMDAGPQST